MPGTKSLEQIIGIQPLTEALRATTSGIPDPFPAELAAVKPANKVLGDRAKWVRIQGTRTTAKLAAYGNPGRRVPLQPIATQNVRMFYVAMEFHIDVNMLARLQSFEQYSQDEGMDFIQYQLEGVAKRMKNTRIVTKASMLRYGAVYWDADGNILPSAAGASFTYSAQVPATHQGQCNGIVSASWTLTNTDIFGQLRVFRQTAAQETGLSLETAMYGLNVPFYLQTNATLQAFFVRNPNFRDTLVETGDIPSGFGGVRRWINTSHAFFEDVNGVNQLLWDNDLLVLMPSLQTPDKMDWWAQMLGSAAVLRGWDAHADAVGALRNCKQEYGESGWAIPTLVAPLGVTVFLQDCQLPAIRNEKALYQVDVTV